MHPSMFCHTYPPVGNVGYMRGFDMSEKLFPLLNYFLYCDAKFLGKPF